MLPAKVSEPRGTSPGVGCFDGWAMQFPPPIQHKILLKDLGQSVGPYSFLNSFLIFKVIKKWPYSV